MENNQIQVIETKSGMVNIIDNVDLNNMKNSLQRINQFQDTVRALFKQNHDYGVIPGTGSKPTLLKPGAEKIIMLLGLTSEFEIEESTRDFENGFFQYYIKCSLLRGDTVVTQGMGAANTKERKFIKQDPFTLDNTVLKMAKKRSMVDAALLVGSLSDIFTQDIEDMDLSGEQINTRKVYTDRDGNISQAQVKRMFAIASGNNDLIKEVLKKYGYESSQDVKKTDYNNICSEIEVLNKQGE